MIRGELAHHSVPDQIQARIADVTGGHAVAIGDGQGQNAGHAAAAGIGFSGEEDVIVCGGDGAADPAFGGTACALEFARDDLNGKVGGAVTSGMSANSVHDEEDAASFVDVDTV